MLRSPACCNAVVSAEGAAQGPRLYTQPSQLTHVVHVIQQQQQQAYHASVSSQPISAGPGPYLAAWQHNGL